MRGFHLTFPSHVVCFAQRDCGAHLASLSTLTLFVRPMSLTGTTDWNLDVRCAPIGLLPIVNARCETRSWRACSGEPCPCTRITFSMMVVGCFVMMLVALFVFEFVGSELAGHSSTVAAPIMIMISFCQTVASFLVSYMMLEHHPQRCACNFQ